jgi:hypothetical protein
MWVGLLLVRLLDVCGGALKFFTREWHGGDMPDAEADGIPTAYLSHISSMGQSLPADARRLVYDVNLHDGLLRSIQRQSANLDIVLRAGDLQVGYFDAQLSYGGADIASGDEHFLKDTVGRRDIELLYDEFDLSEGASWVHRFLFWPYREVAVRFTTLTLRVTPVPGRFDESAT